MFILAMFKVFLSVDLGNGKRKLVELYQPGTQLLWGLSGLQSMHDRDGIKKLLYGSAVSICVVVNMTLCSLLTPD